MSPYACKAWHAAKARGQTDGGLGKQSPRKDERRRRIGDSCVLSGIPKKLYDLNDKRSLGHALCIGYCACTVILIKISAGLIWES